MRLIDADALIKTIGSHCYPVRQEDNSIEPGMTWYGIMQAIYEQPTIKPERIKGVWKRDMFSPYLVRCSVCGKMAPHYSETEKYLLSPFCMFCGTDMTVEDTNEQTD